MEILAFRKTTSKLLFRESGEASQSLLLEGALNALIVVNIAIEILYSYLGMTTPDALRYFVLGSGIVFGLELFLRIWSCVELPSYSDRNSRRLLYVLSPLVILDLAAILPIIFSGGVVNTCFFRIFRLFDLGNYVSKSDVSPLTLVKKSITKRIPEILIVVSILLSMIVFSAFLFNLVEGVGSGSTATLYSALPSIELIVQLLFRSDALETAPISDLGRFILNATQVMGLFLIGLPSVFVTGSFVAELQAANEVKRLRGVESTLIRSFDVINPIPVRKYCESEGLTVKAPERTLDDVQYRMGITIDDVKKIAVAFNTIKLRSVKDPRTENKRVTLERVAINRPYGVFKNEHCDRLILSTQCPGEPGLGPFVENLATNTASSLIANQLFSSGALRSELRQNFAKNRFYANSGDPSSVELSAFVGDIQSVLAQRPQAKVIYLTAMSDKHPEQFRLRHINCDHPAIEKFARGYEDMVIEEWSEQDESVLAMVERLKPGGILKIAMSTKILRSEFQREHFENLVIVRDLVRSVFGS